MGDTASMTRPRDPEFMGEPGPARVPAPAASGDCRPGHRGTCRRPGCATHADLDTAVGMILTAVDDWKARSSTTDLLSLTHLLIVQRDKGVIPRVVAFDVFWMCAQYVNGRFSRAELRHLLSMMLGISVSAGIRDSGEAAADAIIALREASQIVADEHERITEEGT